MSQSCDGNESNNIIKEEDVSPENANENQLVLYDDTVEEVQPIQSHSKAQCPSIGAFTVQCARCLKWRLMPSMEKYEEIREKILESPFFCETASEWKPNMSCEVPADISQDGSRLWAIDKPSISRPPAGWQRLLRIRGEGGTRFADVYYVAPSGKKLRSNVEIQKYLNEQPEHLREGINLSQFSFQIPKPLNENYVRKRQARLMDSNDNSNTNAATEANPLAWISPDDHTTLRLGMSTDPGLYDSHDQPLKRTRISEMSNFGSNLDLADRRSS